MDIRFDLQDESTKESLAFYSRYHIEYVQLEQLNIYLGQKQQKLQDIEAGKSVCGTQFTAPCTPSDKSNMELEIKTLQNGLDGWNKIFDMENTMSLNLSSTVKDWGCMSSSSYDDGLCLTTPVIPSHLSSNAILLTTVPPSFNASDALLENINRIQFSGGGNKMSMKLSLETAISTTKDKPVSNFFHDLVVEGPTIKFMGNEAGNGLEGFVMPLKLSYHHEYKNELTDESTISSSISFELGDEDAQDEFIVELYVDNQFGGIIFKTVGGRSKCPHEKGTAAVEIPSLNVISYPSEKIAADDDLLFYIDVKNLGVGVSLFKFYTQLLRNHDGLTISIDGINLGQELELFSVGSFNNLSPESYRKLVRVQRGPKEFRNPSFMLSWESSCEDSNSGSNDLTASSFNTTATVTE